MKFIDSDYKTIQLSLYMIENDDVKKRAYRFLLSKLISSHTKKYQTKQQLNIYLQNLYGAQLIGRSQLIGNLNVIHIGFMMVNPMIISEEKLVDEAIYLFKDMLEDRNSFSMQIFEDEKRMLIEQWDTIKDHKGLYASIHFNEQFFHGNPQGLPISGYKEDILNLTYDDMINYFLETLKNDKIYFIINGHLNGYQVKFEQDLSKFEQDKPIKLEFMSLKVEEPYHFEDRLEMNQALIKIGYYLPIFRKDPLYEAALCFDLMIGGYVESMMFKTIREEMSLCYDIRSSYDPILGVFVISSGVDLKRKDEALKQILDMMGEPTSFGYNERSLELAKQYLVHQIKSSYDDQNALTIKAFYEDLYGFSTTIDQKIDRINSVTFSDVLEVLNHLKLQTTYVLNGDNHDH